MTVGPTWCVIKMKKGRKLQSLPRQLSSADPQSVEKTCCTLLVEQHTRRGPCLQPICALWVHIYIFIYLYMCACMSVCCRQRGSCTEMRGEVESVGCGLDLKTGTGDRGE